MKLTNTIIYTPAQAVTPTTVLGQVLLLLLLLSLATLRAAGLERVPLPPGYSHGSGLIPHVDIPDPLFDPPRKGCHTCGTDDGIRLLYEDYAIWRHDLDRYGHKNSTWELLTFEVGTKSAWLGPQHAARLYHHSKDSVRFVTRERLVVFDVRKDDNGTVSLECVSDPGEWSLRRDGDRIIVESPLRWWAFESAGLGGEEFRLVETCMHTFPFPVKLHYDGPHPMLPSELEYPDGKMAIIEAAPGTEIVGKITLPNGIVYKITYDANSFAESLEEYVPTTEKPKQELKDFTIANEGGEIKQSVRYEKPKSYLKLTRRYMWQNDAFGRLQTMIYPCGQEMKVTFAQSVSDQGDEILTIMTDQTTGNYEYMRHIGAGGMRTTERGHGHGGQPIEEATFESREVKKNIHHTMRTTSFTHGATGRTLVTQYDPKGTPLSVKEVDATGNVLAVRKLEPPKMIDYRGVGEPDAARVGTPDAVTYTYNQGVLATATYHGKVHVVEVDSLGRLLSDRVGDHVMKWTYTDFAQVETNIYRVEVGGQAVFEHVRIWTYTDQGHVHTYRAGNLPRETYHYSCAGLDSLTVGKDKVYTFRYNDLFQLRSKTLKVQNQGQKGSQQDQELFRYKEDGRLDALRVRKGNVAQYTVIYRYDRESGERHIRTTSGQVPPELLNTVQVKLTIQDDFGRKHRSYNKLGALMASSIVE